MPELKTLSYKPTGTFFGDSSGEPLSDSPGTTDTGYSISHSLSGGELPKSVSYGDLNRETLYTIMNDQTGKYIGSKPTSAKLQDTTSQAYQSGQIPSAGQLAPDTKKTPVIGDVAKTAGTEVGKAVLDTVAAKANLAQDTLASDMRYWQEQGKYWFDKEQDVRPDIEKYLAEMPSSTGALVEGTMTGGTWSNGSNTGKGVSAAMLDPVGFAVGASGSKKAEFVWNKTGEGAVSGAMTGGGVGAVVGAALGAIMSLFTWSASESQDKKNKELARIEMEKRLKEWTINRNNRLLNQRKNTIAETEAKKSVYEAKKKAEQSEKNAMAISRRDSIRKAFENAGTIAKNKRMERGRRWGRSYRNAA